MCFFFCTSALLYRYCTLGRVALFFSIQLIASAFIILVCKLLQLKSLLKELMKVNVNVVFFQICSQRIEPLAESSASVHLVVCINCLHSALLFSKANTFQLV